MVRCDEFYAKWQKDGNFCEKHPDTAEKIDLYLSELSDIKNLAATLLSDDELKILETMRISEHACRPLIRLSDQSHHDNVVERILRFALTKYDKGKPIVVTSQDVKRCMGINTGVYIIKCNEFYKIGMTDDLKTRLSELQISNPYPLAVIKFISCNNVSAVGLETQLHNMFSKKHIRGEWFQLDESDLATLFSYTSPQGAR